MKKVLIIGIDGFVGGYLANEFSDNGYSVSGTTIGNTANIVRRYNIYRLDILNIKDVENIICEISPDVIVNLAAISSVGESWSVPQATMQVNLIGALNILETIKNHSLNIKLLFIGSSEEYIASNEPINEEVLLNSNNPYGISKIALEEMVRLYRDRYGMTIYYVRAFNHTGIGQRDTFVLPSFCKQVAKIKYSGLKETMKVGNISVKRDFSHVKDVVRAYRLIIEKGDSNEIYNVGSGKAYSLKELLEYVIHLSEESIKYEVDKSRFRPTDHIYMCCDNSKITSELNWTADYTVFDALAEMYTYYLNEYKNMNLT